MKHSHKFEEVGKWGRVCYEEPIFSKRIDSPMTYKTMKINIKVEKCKCGKIKIKEV